MSEGNATASRPRPNWALILGLLVGVGVALAIFIPALMTRPSPKSANTPVSSIAAPAFTLADSDGLSFPVSPGGGTRTVLIFNMGVG